VHSAVSDACCNNVLRRRGRDDHVHFTTLTLKAACSKSFGTNVNNVDTIRYRCERIMIVYVSRVSLNVSKYDPKLN